MIRKGKSVTFFQKLGKLEVFFFICPIFAFRPFHLSV